MHGEQGLQARLASIQKLLRQRQTAVSEGGGRSTQTASFPQEWNGQASKSVHPATGSPLYPTLQSHAAPRAGARRSEHVAFAPHGLLRQALKSVNVSDANRVNQPVQPRTGSPVYPSLHVQVLESDGADWSVHAAFPPQGCVAQASMSRQPSPSASKPVSHSQMRVRLGGGRSTHRDPRGQAGSDVLVQALSSMSSKTKSTTSSPTDAWTNVSVA